MTEWQGIKPHTRPQLCTNANAFLQSLNLVLYPWTYREPRVFSLSKSRGKGHSDTPHHRTGLRLMGSPTKHPLPRFHSGPKAAAPACQHLLLQSLAPPLGLLGCHTLSPHLSAEQRVFTLQMCRGSGEPRLSPLSQGSMGQAPQNTTSSLSCADYTHSEGVTLATQLLPPL